MKTAFERAQAPEKHDGEAGETDNPPANVHDVQAE
jgi:hypothetical protein